jgi:hypothetical protein
MTQMADIPENAMLARAFAGGAQASVNIAGRSVYPEFLTDGQKQRLERIVHNRMIFDGRHREYFLEAGRTCFDFPYVRSCGRLDRMYYAYNVLGLICIKGADLLFGQAPTLDVEDEAQYQAIDGIARRSRLPAVLHDAAVTANAEGGTFLEAILWREQVYIRRLANEEVFPEGELQPDGQYPAYVRYSARNVGTDQRPIWLLLSVRMEAGKISRECWQLDNRMRKANRVGLENFSPELKGQDVTLTGIDENTVIWCPNALGRDESDIGCAIPQQDALNAKNSQVARVLQKHADPKLAAPRQAGDPAGNLTPAEVYWFDEEGQIPRYITWDAQLATAMSERDKTLTQLLVRTETSPVLLGLKEGAAPDAYKKVRLEAFNSLTKATRKNVIWTPAVQTILDVAQKLEQTIPGIRGSYPIEPVGVTLHDGIPIDESEQASNIATLRAAGVMSRYRGVIAQVQDKEAAEAEITQIETEASQATPSVLFGEPEAAGQGDRGEGSGDSTDATTPEAEATGQDLQTSQATVLNGAQVTAATAIVTAVAAGEIPRDAGMGQLKIFYNLTDEQAAQVMGSAGTNTPTTPNPKPTDPSTASTDGGAA